MEFEEIINQHGLEKAIKSLFPDLEGIDISSVIYDKKSQESNPLAYMIADIDGDWYFGVGSMPMIFKGKSADHYSCNEASIPFVKQFIRESRNEFKRRIFK